MDYKEYNDYELLSFIYDKSEDAADIMYSKYMGIINTIANKKKFVASLVGLEYNDLIQEGMLGLSNAINNFKDDRNATFYTFACLCIERQMDLALRTSGRKKHKNLNDAVSFDYKTDDDSNITLYDTVTNSDDLLENIINKEQYEYILSEVNNKCTEFEKQVFNYRLDGLNYKDIANILNKDVKSIDNAVQRIKAKIKDIIGSNDI